MRICVTGASGKVGRATVEDLRTHGHDVTAVDLVTVREHSGPVVVGADLTDATQAAEVLARMDAVVHIANHPAPDLVPPTRTFTENVAMNFNVLNGAVAAGPQSSPSTPRTAPVPRARLALIADGWTRM